MLAAGGNGKHAPREVAAAKTLGFVFTTGLATDSESLGPASVKVLALAKVDESADFMPNDMKDILSGHVI